MFTNNPVKMFMRILNQIRALSESLTGLSGGFSVLVHVCWLAFDLFY